MNKHPRKIFRGLLTIRLLPCFLFILFSSACTDHTNQITGKWYIKKVEYEDGRKPIASDSMCFSIDFRPEHELMMQGLVKSEGRWDTNGDKIYLQTEIRDTLNILKITRDSLVVRFPSKKTFMRYLMTKTRGARCK